MRVANATPGTGALASIYAVDSTASPIAGSVVTTDSTGTFNFYAPDGRYDLVVAFGATTKTVADIEISDITESQSGDVAAKFGTLNFTTALQHNGVPFAAADLSNGVTGAGSVVLATSPVLVTPSIDVATGTSLALGGGTALTTTNQTGTGNLVLATSPTLVTPSLGTATAASINKVVLTQPATVATLTILNNKTLTANNSLTLAGSDATTLTFQGSDTYIGRATTDTLTNKRITQRVVTVTNSTTLTPDGDNSDVSAQVNTQTAGTLTVAAPTGTPTDGQKLIIRVKTTNAQTYSFNATYAFSTSVTAPTTLAAGKTDYIGLMWNATNTKWDVVAVDQGH